MSIAVIRKAEPDDAEAFAACHLACWQETYGDLWGPERFARLDPESMAMNRRKEIQTGTADHYLAELDGDVVAIAIAGPARGENPPTERELYAIYLRKEHQGSGTADDLLTASIGEEPAFLWVYRDNARASAFYVNHDFIPDGEERLDSEGILEIRMVRR